MGYHKPIVNIKGYGDAIYTTLIELNFKQAVYNVFPTNGSISGGQIITIQGRGFRNDTIVSLGIQNCDIIYLSSSEINCITPSVFVSHYGNITAINGFELDLNLTNWISSVDIM